jgi:Cu(I)/Ag(I) efflux system membrane fusion protein
MVDLRFVMCPKISPEFLPPLLLAILVVLVPACSKPDKPQAGMDANVAYYTCGMHPWIRSHHAGDTCPICGMDLVPVMKPGHEQASGPSKLSAAVSNDPSEFFIPPAQQQLIGVTYANVATRTLDASIRVPGTVEPQKELRWDCVTHVDDGYVHQLKVFTAGDTVEKGQPLMDLYSPCFLEAEGKFIALLRKRDEAGPAAAKAEADRDLTVARTQLAELGVPDEQIADLEQTRMARGYIDVIAPVAGMLTALPVNQGQRVRAGTQLAVVVDPSMVWVWAQLQQDDLPRMAHEAFCTVSCSSLPGVVYHGKIAVFDHDLDPVSRTARMGILLDNSDNRLHPNMYVDIEMPLNSYTGLAVPASAVLPMGEHDLVFVDRGEGRLEPRSVQLGARYGDFYAVERGLREGERVVNSANFLVDAESKIQGVVQSW